MTNCEIYAVCRIEPGGLRIWFAPFRRLQEASGAMRIAWLGEPPGQRLCVVRVRWEGAAAREVMIVDRLTGRGGGRWVEPLPSLAPNEEAILEFGGVSQPERRSVEL